jgi:hypothetical protein
MRSKRYPFWKIREDKLQSLYESDAWSGRRGTYHCSFYYDYKIRREGRCEQRSRDPWPTHEDYCPKCHERLLNEIRRYPIRRNLATNKMVYDYSHGKRRWKSKKK